MRLLRVYIDGYRNLKNVEVDFDKDSLTTVVIGENGSGKSNLIEAIAEYTYQVLALARAGRPDTWRVVREALESIVTVRSRQARELRASPPARRPPAHPPITTATTPA